MKWIVLCNGGPNEVIVGKEVKTRTAGIKLLGSMMKMLTATHGIVVREDKNPYVKADFEKYMKEEEEKHFEITGECEAYFDAYMR